MKLSGLHLLLTYQCNYECDHCFVWGSPWQSGTMTLENIRHILNEAAALGTVDSIYFEGGEPFLYYPIMVKGVREAHEIGFKVGIVSNAYWGTSIQDAIEWLLPFTAESGRKPIIEDLSISSDFYHCSETTNQLVNNIRAAAEQLGINIGIISIAQPESEEAVSSFGQLSNGESGIMYRGRAVQSLVSDATLRPWEQFSECPYEDLQEPGRVHVDPLGHLHICQGISIGNIFEIGIVEICKSFNPLHHPIIGPLLEGGPVELVKRHNLSHQAAYADACHLCYLSRLSLRSTFQEVLLPDQVYGLYSKEHSAS